MKRRTRKIIGAVVVVGAIAAGGAAYTAANTVPATVAGYGSAAVTGATVTNVKYTFSDDGTKIDQVDLTFNASQTGNTVTAGFSSGVPPTLDITCDVDGTTGLTAKCGDKTTAPLAKNTASATTFAVAVKNTN